MQIADLHIHSKYSRATSRDGDLPHLDLWARRKGIHLIGTGDFTHPAWRFELEEQLVPAGEGVYTLRPELRLPDETGGEPFIPRFVVSGEISSIYKKNGRTRKVHNVILLPGLAEAERLAARLELVGNIHSDGRPILGLDSRDLLELTLEVSPEAIFIPAHIWTPHFSLFGAFSGFDTIEECFEDLTPHIHALETGLSSDPPMNWRVSQLDRFTLVSHSDAHSPAKLGREANLVDLPELDYPHLKRAIETGEGFTGTVEFFPEEGKYHLDGHRNCNLSLTPAETAAYGGRCPVCGKKITIGVLNRVDQLADRPEGYVKPGAKIFESLATLPEVIAASTGLSAGGTKVEQRYFELLHKLGPEFTILRETPLDEIGRAGGPCLAEGIRRLRAGQVERISGYDGEYGRVLLLSPDEIEDLNGQTSLFGGPEAPKKGKKKSLPAKTQAAEEAQKEEKPRDELNERQAEAVQATEQTVAVIAGPGTGKTKTLVARIAHLVEEQGIKPAQITAVTFTNRAAAEMRERLEGRLGKRRTRGITIGTFHSICYERLGRPALISGPEGLKTASEIIGELGLKLSARALLQRVSLIKNGRSFTEAGLLEETFTAYEKRLEERGLVDFDDLLQRELARQETGTDHLLVDEFQDCNEMQLALIKQWSEGKNLFVIGDPDQSIYAFRGAAGQCFERLAQLRPGLRTIRLQENYRSTPQIISAALCAIAKNGGEARELRPNRPAGEPVRLLSAPTDFSEGVFIAKEIGRLTGGVDMLSAQEMRDGPETIRSFSDIAVLCRTNRQLELIEKCLRHDDIPCVVSGRGDFLDAPDVGEALVFFDALLKEGAQAGTRGEEFLKGLKKEKPQKLLKRYVPEPSPAMEKLMAMAVFFPDMESFLDNLRLGGEGDFQRRAGKEVRSGAVQLMTLHAAKGLEFPVVFLAGLKAGTLPLEAVSRETDLSEERRLFYVGLTRAKEELILLAGAEPSVFLQDLPKGELARGTVIERGRQPEGKQLSLF